MVGGGEAHVSSGEAHVGVIVRGTSGSKNKADRPCWGRPGGGRGVIKLVLNVYWSL